MKAQSSHSDLVNDIFRQRIARHEREELSLAKRAGSGLRGGGAASKQEGSEDERQRSEFSHEAPLQLAGSLGEFRLWARSTQVPSYSCGVPTDTTASGESRNHVPHTKRGVTCSRGCGQRELRLR